MLLLSMASMPGLGRCIDWGRMELRIDVDREDRVDDELDALWQRMRTPGDSIHGLPRVSLGDPRFGVRWREADGEFYLYVEDLQRGCLAGTTVFNRLIELDRRADRFLRAPHSRYGSRYRRLGLATVLYRWGLDAGLCLMTGARQSPAANALWDKLARDYPRLFVDLQHKRMRNLGSRVAPEVLGALPTRMVLLGRGWTVGGLALAAGLRTESHAARESVAQVRFPFDPC